MKTSRFYFLFSLALILIIPISAFSLGFKNPSVDPRASGMAGSANADIASPAVLWFNPAGINYLDGVELSFGANFLIPKWERDDGAGNVTKTSNALYVIPDFYLSYNPQNIPVAFGLALNSPFGNGIDWGQDSFAKYAVTKARMSLFNIQPTIAILVNDYVSLGFGVNMYVGTLDYRTKVNAATISGDPSLAGTDVDSRFDGRGFQTTFTVGAMIRPIKPLTLGLVFRTGDDINFDGDLNISNLPLSIAGIDTIGYKATISSIIPAEISFGINYYILTDLKIEFDLNWTKWSSLGVQAISVPGKPAFNQTIIRTWKDSMTYSVGGEWFAAKWLALRLGYSYLENSVPDISYEPSVPDTNRHVISSGFGIKYKKYLINFAYEAVISEANSVNNGFFDGTYDALANIISLGVQYSF